MTAARFSQQFVYAFSLSGVPIPKAELHFYYTQSNVEADSYTSPTMVTKNTNPVIANQSGLFPAIYLSREFDYKAVLTYPEKGGIPGQIVWTSDPVGGEVIGPVSAWTEEIIADDGQTRFFTARQYIRGHVNVHVNGSLLSITEYQAPGGSEIVLNEPAQKDDVVVIESVVGSESTMNPTAQRAEYIATAGQTVFEAPMGFQIGYMSVFINGSKLADADFDDSDGVNIVLAQPAHVGDIVALEGFIGSGTQLDAVNIIFLQEGDGAIPRSAQDKMRETITPQDFGAKADGVADDTPAIQAATNIGKPVYFPPGRYLMATPVTHTGRVQWSGEGASSILVCDGEVLTATAASGSRIDNLWLENETVPWTIIRDPSNWTAVPVVAQTNTGYQPTVNDTDIYPSLTPEQQAQDIGPKLMFQGDASDIRVSHIYGRFVSIIIKDAIHSEISDCDIHGGKNFASPLLFWNIEGQQGQVNKITRNRVRGASYSGACMSRNHLGEISYNTIENVGESGTKTWQNAVMPGGGEVAPGTPGSIDARCTFMRIIGNFSNYAYYDGLDCISNYPPDGTHHNNIEVRDNLVVAPRRVGIYGEGIGMNVAGNRVFYSGLSGLMLYAASRAMLKGNAIIECNASNEPVGHHGVAFIGDAATISDNTVVQIVVNGYAIYAPGTNVLADNNVTGGDIFIGNPGGITAAAHGNYKAGSAILTSSLALEARQTGVAPALQLYNDNGDNTISMTFHPYRPGLPNPMASITAITALGGGGTELGFLQLKHARNGAQEVGLSVVGLNSPAYSWVAIQAPNQQPDSGTSGLNGNVSFWIDEAAGQLKAMVKYSNGAVHTASIALV